MSLELYQEPVTPTGGQKSEGVQNVLGRPPMNWITVVLREAVQNSWDARQGDGPVEFEIRWTKPTKDQKVALRDLIFTNEPAGSGIRHAIQQSDFDLLIFTDRGTKGLSGPVMANQEPVRGEKRNFVDFVWEIGRSEGTGPGGGTYGYGKTSFFRLSRFRTVCIYSRCLWQAQMEDRFIAAHLGPSSSKLTGRSWWGDVTQGGIQPVTGREACKLAESIGIPIAASGVCGTSIVMLCPRLDDLTREDDGGSGLPAPQQVLRTLAESLVQWFWPKMLDLDDGKPAMVFRLFHDGNPIPVPTVESIPPFNAYAEALQLLRDWRRGQKLPSHAHAVVIECGRPRATLGHLVMVKRAKKNRAEHSGEYGEASARELFLQSHHVVLLRKPMLVVKYLRGVRPPSDQMDYSGVFVVASGQLGGEVEKAFALSEPATHDDWVPESLEDRNHKTYVRVALRRIKEAFSEFATPVSVTGGAETQAALGAFSEMLGNLLAGSAEGTGARVQESPLPSKGGGVSAGGKKSRVELDGQARMILLGENRCVAVPFRVVAAKGVTEVQVRATPVVLLEQGAEKDPPRDAKVPEVHSFCCVQNGREVEVLGTGSTVNIPAIKMANQWIARVSIPDETRIRVDLAIVT